jgi:NADPH:quinone reductase-like Zn-dependent oxidoreductase
MKAYESERNGIDALKLVDLPDPKPGVTEVLVKIRATSLNYRDLATINGTYAGSGKLIPVSDGAGEIVAIGEKVSKFKVGDRVAGVFEPKWQGGGPKPEKIQLALGGNLPGLLREYAVFDENEVVPLPEYLSYQEAATLPVAAVTAWYSLRELGKITAGETVLVLGTGGVSIFALQLAKIFGAKVIVTSSSDAKLARARALGADETINYRTTPDWDQEVLRLTDGHGAGHVVEVGGAKTMAQSIQAAAVGANIAVVGYLSGKNLELPVLPVIAKMLRIQGLRVGSKETFLDLLRAMSVHKLRPVIDKVFKFNEVKDALRYMESGSHFGKIVIEH